ncbi:2OG-Fe(II) oxygenase [Corallococcus sp. AB050B]|nr:2OG-Fe(II) oxygenase [Corallococcus sp. AB050B]
MNASSSSEVAGMDWAFYARELKNTGSAMLPAYMVFSEQELEQLDSIQSRIPEEAVVRGDAGDTHDIYVRRIMTDKAGEYPTAVNQPISDEIIGMLSDDKRKRVLSALFGSDSEYFIRRCQMNRMVKNSFIGLHLDAASNPDYEFSVIVQLGRSFEGGEFVVHVDSENKQVFRPTYGTVLVTTCKLSHEVWKVLDGERNALVYFYAKNGGINSRAPGA